MYIMGPGMVFQLTIEKNNSYDNKNKQKPFTETILSKKDKKKEGTAIIIKHAHYCLISKHL